MIQIERRLKPGRYRLTDVFPDLRGLPILGEIFENDREIEEVFAETLAVIVDRQHEMSVDNHNGHISIGIEHLRHADSAILYLDIVHELVHVRQFRQGLDLYDKAKPYVDRPTEIEAYLLTVEEARRIGFTRDQIVDYLRVDWISQAEHRRLVKNLNI